jgi:hypothetical protein
MEIAYGSQGMNQQGLVRRFQDKKFYNSIDTDGKGGITEKELKTAAKDKKGEKGAYARALLGDKDLLKKLSGSDHAFGKGDLKEFLDPDSKKKKIDVKG